MRTIQITLIAATLLVSAAALAKDKPKLLPAYVLQARTVAVLVDPDAGVSIDDPRANQVAQKDVEAALQSWGRLQPVLSTEGADLIILIRKGNGKVASQTIPDPRQNSRPGTVTSTDDSISMGAQHGRQPDLSSNPGASPTLPRPQLEVGESTDSLSVFQGGVGHPLDGSPAWRSVSENGLRSHSVPAVGEFRKAIAEAEKAAAKKP